jgi:uncharacterized DUF497 family protein
MKRFEWDSRKNEKLIQERGLSFETILWSIQFGGLLDIVEHSNPKKYPGQKIFVVHALDYVFLVPFEESEEVIKLKTIIPSRKAVQKYLKKEKRS